MCGTNSCWRKPSCACVCKARVLLAYIQHMYYVQKVSGAKWSNAAGHQLAEDIWVDLPLFVVKFLFTTKTWPTRGVLEGSVIKIERPPVLVWPCFASCKSKTRGNDANDRRGTSFLAACLLLLAHLHNPTGWVLKDDCVIVAKKRKQKTTLQLNLSKLPVS